MPNRVNVDQLLIDLNLAAQAAGFARDGYGQVAGRALPAYVRRCREPATSPQRIYLSAGIHGDEPAGPLALLALLREKALLPEHDYYLCPLMNPGGLEAGTRENSDGIDLNRDYTAFRSTEIASHRDWVQDRISGIDLALHLHEDWEAEGFYLYELNFDTVPDRAPAILDAVRRFIPIENATRIDGHRARGGVIRPREIPDIPEGFPEAIYFQKQFGGLNYTLETPSKLNLDKRVAALKAAVLAAIG